VLATSLTARQESLVGAWELMSAKNAGGEALPSVNLLLIVTSDGLNSQIGTPKGRPKLDKPANQLTEAEFRARFTGVQRQHGTYTLSGNRITRQAAAAVSPNNEGRQQVQESLPAAFRLSEGERITATRGEPNAPNGTDRRS
jgi:hypothetical protein